MYYIYIYEIHIYIYYSYIIIHIYIYIQYHLYLPIFHIFQAKHHGVPGGFQALHGHGLGALPLRRLFGFPGGRPVQGFPLGLEKNAEKCRIPEISRNCFKKMN